MIFRGVSGGDSPEVESFETFFFSVEDRSSEQGDGRGEFFIGGVGGRLHIKTSFRDGVVEEEGSGDNIVLIFDEIEGSERHFEFVFKVGGRESTDTFFLREFRLDFNEVFYIVGIFRDSNRETFFREGIKTVSGTMRKIQNDFFFRGG